MDSLKPEDQKLLMSLYRRGVIMRWVAIVLLLVALLMAAVILINPTMILPAILGDSNQKRGLVENYLHNVQTHTDLERDLLESNLLCSQFTWDSVVLFHVRIVSIFAAYLLGVGVLSVYFSSILMKIGDIVRKIKQ